MAVLRTAQLPSVQVDTVVEVLDAAQPALISNLSAGPYDLVDSGEGGGVTIVFETELDQYFIQLDEGAFDSPEAATLEEVRDFLAAELATAGANILVGIVEGLLTVTTSTVGEVAYLSIGGAGSARLFFSDGEGLSAYGVGGAVEALVINRIPEPDEAEVRADQAISFQLVDPTGVMPDTQLLAVFVNGEVVYDPEGFWPGWSGEVAPLHADEPGVLAFTLVRDVLFESSELVTVDLQLWSVEVQHVWSFIIQDLTRPTLEDVSARDVQMLHVIFDEALDPLTIADPAQYELVRLSTFAVLAQPIAATRVDSHTVALIFPIPLTFGATYELRVSGMKDVRGNLVAPVPNDRVTFTAFNPTVPDGRRFLLWDFIPEKNKREDKTRDLFKVISILQEVTNCLLYDIDRMAELIDPDLAPERFVEAMLADLGNPFPTAELALVDKRRLLAVLVSIYQLKGTAPGVVHAVRFLLGLEVEVLPVEQGSGWILGAGQLSHTAILGPSTLYQRYSFNVQVEEALTPTQRRRIVEIVEFMKPAHTHLLYILEPGSEDDGVIDHVALGYSLLGSNWFLHA